MHHVGILYHLIDPVTHILKMQEVMKKVVMLDTNLAILSMRMKSKIDGERFEYMCYLEYGKSEML